MKTRSYALPVILIGLGIVFLVNNAVPEIQIWSVLGQYWPVLLILFGLIQLFEVLARFSRNQPTGSPSGFRPMGWGWVPLLIIVGLAISIPRHGAWKKFAPIKAVTGVELFGEEFDYPVSLAAPLGPARRIVLDNLRGNVTVNGGEGTEIHIDGHKIVRALDRDSASRTSERTKVVLAPEDNSLFIRAAEDPGPDGPDRSLVSLDLEITVPKGVNIEARGRGGDLSVDQIAGTVDVTSQKGEVRLTNIAGDSKLDVEHCNLVRAANIKGTLNVQGDGRDIQLDNVAGQVTISGRFSGTLDFRSLAQPLHFESEQTDFRIAKLPGNINMDLGELRAQNVVGPLRLVTHSRDVHLDDFTGPVDIDLGHGDIDLKPNGKQQLARMDVRSRDGNIELALPVNAEFDLRASTQQGEATNDYGDAVVSGSQGRAASLKSAKAAGPAIVLDTRRGEVSVRKLE